MDVQTSSFLCWYSWAEGRLGTNNKSIGGCWPRGWLSRPSLIGGLRSSVLFPHQYPLCCPSVTPPLSFTSWKICLYPSFTVLPLSHSTLAFLCLLSAFFVSLSLFFSLVPEKSLQGKKKSLTYEFMDTESFDPLNLWSGNQVWLEDKETEHKLSGSKTDKGERRKDKIAGVIEWDKRKELASSLGWMAPEQLPSISHNFCSSRVTVATQDIWAQP